MYENRNEELPSPFHFFLARLLVGGIFILIVMISWPIFQEMRDRGWFPEPRIEISGFEPNEYVTVERPFSFINSTRKAQADAAGKIVFHNTGPGKWRVTKGGTKELQNITIFIPDRHGIFTKTIGQFEITTIFKRGS